MSRNVHLRQGGLKYRKIWWRNARYAIERNDAATGKRHRNSWGFYFAREMVVGEPIRWQQLGIYARATQVSTGSEESQGGKHLREILGDLSCCGSSLKKRIAASWSSFIPASYTACSTARIHAPWRETGWARPAVHANALAGTRFARACTRIPRMEHTPVMVARVNAPPK